MHRIHRAIVVMPVLAFLIAACAAPNAGGQASGPAGDPSAAPSHGAEASADPAASSAATPSRVDIGVLAEDPGAFAGSEIRILARVDEVTSEGQAFLTSPSATTEGQLLVVLAEDGELATELAVGNVVWVDGTVVGATADELSAAGAATTEPPAAYEGEYAIVASALTDPLGGDAVE